MVKKLEEIAEGDKKIEKRLKLEIFYNRLVYTGLGFLAGAFITATTLYLDNFIHDNFLRDAFPRKIEKRVEISPYLNEEDALILYYYNDDKKTSGGGITFFKYEDRYVASDEAFRNFLEKKKK